jgi:hypothetical protein
MTNALDSGARNMARRVMALASVILRCYNCNVIGNAKNAQTGLAVWATQKRDT